MANNNQRKTPKFNIFWMYGLIILFLLSMLWMNQDGSVAQEVNWTRFENIVSKGGEGGRLFGSITSKDISEALEEQHGIKIDKKKIVLDSPIKHTGDTEVTVKVYPEVHAQLKVSVTV